MLLSEAIAKNASNVAAAQLTYQQNVVAVTTAMFAVSQTSLPSLFFPPPNFSDFATALLAAKANALQWTNEVLAKLLDVPDDVANNNQVITQILSTCATFAQQLEQAPNPEILQALNADLTALSSQLGLMTTFISGALDQVTNFNNLLPTLTGQLNTLLDDFTQQENVDQDQINALQADITQLQSDISQQVQKIVDAAIAIGAALVLGSLADLTPAGILVGVLVATVVVAAAIGIDLAVSAIESDKAQISADTTQMNEFTQDAAACMTQAGTFNTLVQQMAMVSSSLNAVLQQWTTLQEDINSAVMDVMQTTNDTSTAQFAAVLTDLQAALTEWTSVDQLAVSLKLTMNGTAATVQAGMPPQEVQAIVQSAPTPDIITFLNQAAAAA
ncbi:MAG TPA: hypothetical protein VGS07_03170 [Thermoanaerobaculia bacterium]|jgi:hypothetical protein|nr:hypothetical protein [Thermoanaerobaculia bacterium]